MKAILLAAGEGKRMRPLTANRPKVMLPLANKPILEHLLIEAVKAGVSDFIFIVGYYNEQVRDYFGSGKEWGVNISYASQQKQMGTADALWMVQDSIDSKFLLINGDIILKSHDLEKMMGAECTTLGITAVEDTRNLGAVEVSGDNVIRIYEKAPEAPSNMANTGVYLFTPEIFSAVSQTLKSPRGEFEITDSLQLMIDNGYDIHYHEFSSWLDLSYPWDLLSANESLLGSIEARNLGKIESNVVVQGNVSIGAGTVVRSGSYIVGPVIIGANCDIGPNCYIRSCTCIGDGCHIGSAVEVKNSIVMKDSKVPHHNYLGDSVVGEGCNFGAGTKVANLRLDKKNVRVANIDTRRRKLGAIIGDGVETGINASINTGSIIGYGTRIGPGAVASGFIKPGSRIL